VYCFHCLTRIDCQHDHLHWSSLAAAADIDIVVAVGGGGGVVVERHWHKTYFFE